MTYTLTILEGLHEPIMQLRIKNEPIERELYDIDLQICKAIDCLTALSEPFDPAKHMSGWVKSSDSEYETTWLIGYARLSLVLDNVYVLENDGFYFHGHIPTAAFFHALCGALNIK